MSAPRTKRAWRKKKKKQKKTDLAWAPFDLPLTAFGTLVHMYIERRNLTHMP